MKTLLVATLAATAMLTAYPAAARDQGIINQAGPAEATQKFYLHPAHFFWSSEAPHHNAQHPAVLVNRGEVERVEPSANMSRHPALQPRTILLVKAPASR